MLALLLALAMPAAASACPGDGGPAPQAIKDHFCGTWNGAEARGFQMGEPSNNAHRWGSGWVRDFRNSGTFGSGVLMEGDGVGYAYIVGNPQGQWYWDAFRASGDVTGMGYPVGRHEFGGHLNDGPRGNRYMTFQDGVVNSYSGGTFGVRGAIRRKWDATGHVTGLLGHPLSNAYATAARGGAAQRFEGGYITHNPAVPGEFVTPHGPISDKYISRGSSRGPLGLPTSDEFRGERGNQAQRFDEGQITSHAGGTFETRGSIFKRWAKSNASNGVLGFPVSDEYATAAGGGAASKFEHGVITFNPRTNLSYVSAFAILDKYSALGASNSYLVLPTSEEYDWEGGRRQNFDGGYVWWHPQLGAYADRTKPNPASVRPPPSSDPTQPAPVYGPPAPSPPVARGPLRFAAIGDSVTAGFGYRPEGEPLEQKLTFRRLVAKILRCRSGDLAKAARCSHKYLEYSSGDLPWNYQSPRIRSYPAQYATQRGFAPTEWENVAVTGSEPRDWLPRGLDPALKKDGKWVARLNNVLARRPNLVTLTLGGNPTLGNFAFWGRSANKCFHAADTELAARFCALDELLAEKLTPRLEALYRHVLKSLPASSRVVVFRYHETVPLLMLLAPSLEKGGQSEQQLRFNTAKSYAVLAQLNKGIETAVTRVQRSVPGGSKRLILLTPDSGFRDNDCSVAEAWVQLGDLCIHPTAAGYARFASALQRVK